MAARSNIKIAGLALMIIGIGLAYWGYDMSGSLGSQLSQTFAGSSGDAVILRYIGGVACFAAGLFLFIKK